MFSAVIVLQLLTSMLVAPLVSGIVANRVYEKLRRAEEEGTHIDIYSLNILERTCARAVLWLRKRGIPLSWACRLGSMILTLLIVLAVNSISMCAIALSLLQFASI